MNNRFRRYLSLFASLQMTMFSLGLMMMLVFFGTLAQVHIGTFAAQEEYFNRFFIWGHIFGVSIPILPGGLLVGGIWFLNLLAAFIVRFKLQVKNTGIIISHLGLLIMLLGQFFTQTMAKESQLPIEIGESKNYSEIPREAELAFVDVSDSKTDEVTAIPYSIFSRQKKISPPSLPFQIHIKEFFPNAELYMLSDQETALADQGVGAKVGVRETPPVTVDDDINNVSAVIELSEGEKSLGTWLVSYGLGAPQSVVVGNKEFRFSIRPTRNYFPFELTLKEFHHDLYPGTQIPKNYSSLVHLLQENKKENRDVLIYMNHPLRYDGKTFYQSSFGKNDTLSVFQVVENPFWLTPYISCLMVVLGLAIQFLSHLTQFVRSRP